MREEIRNWVKQCVNELAIKMNGHNDALLLVEAFVTQYELKAIKILESDKSLNYNLPYYKQKLKSFFSRREWPEIKFTNPKNSLDLLFWPFQKIHVDSQLEIYKKLSADNEYDVGIFSHNDLVQNLLKRSKLNEVILTDYVKPVWRDYKKLSFYKSLMETIRTLPDLDLMSTNISFKEVLLLSWNSWFWLYEYSIHMFNEIVNQYNPKAIFVGNTTTLAGNIISQLAHAKGIKTFCIMHGRMEGYIEFGKFDYFYLFGNKDYENLIKDGISPIKCVVSGSPKIDNLLNQVSQKNENLNSLEKIIFVALSGPGHSITTQHHIQILKTIYKVAHELDHVNFKFKLHKKDKMLFYSDLVKLPNVFVANYGEKSVSSNIYDWIREADILITGASTSAMDAMLMNCPVITIDLKQHLNEIDFIREKISVHTKNYDELIFSINELLKKQVFFRDHLNASKRYILDLYTQPENGSVNYIVEHLKTKLNEI